MRKLLVITILIAIAAAALLWWQNSQRPAQAGAQASLLPLLAEEDTAGYARATEPGAIQFPRDLGPHPEYQTEWWYYTGNLQAPGGRRFGYQLTFFRRALSTPQFRPNAVRSISPERSSVNLQSPSDWRTTQLYLAHFTISDVDGKEFYANERYSR